MPTQNRLEGTVHHHQEFEQDESDLDHKLKTCATNFLTELQDQNPGLYDDLHDVVTNSRLENQKVLELRPDWISKDAPITDWDRTAHFRNGHLPDWIKPEKAEQAAVDITHAFNEASDHMTQDERRQSAEQLTELLARPTNYQTQAAAALEHIPVTDEFHDTMKDWVDLTKTKLVEGLSTNDTGLVYNAVYNMGSIQREVELLDKHLEHINVLNEQWSTKQSTETTAANFIAHFNTKEFPYTEDIRSYMENKHLNDEEALELRANWVPKNAPITEWDRTAHFRNEEIPHWMTREQGSETEGSIIASIHMNNSFQEATAHLQENDKKENAEQLTALLTGRVKDQLAAAQGIEEFPVTDDFHLSQGYIIQSAEWNLTEGLIQDDYSKVYKALEHLREVQEDLNYLDLAAENPELYGPVPARTSRTGYSITHSPERPEAPAADYDTGTMHLTDQGLSYTDRETVKAAADTLQDNSMEILNHTEQEERAQTLEAFTETLHQTEPHLVQAIAANEYTNLTYPKEADTALFQAAQKTVTAFNLDSSQKDHLTEALTDLITHQARQAAENLRQSGTQWKIAHQTDEVSGPYTLYSPDGTPLSDYEQRRLLHTAHSEAYRLMGSLNSAPHGWEGEEQAREKIQEAIDELNALRFPPDPPEQPPGVMERISNLFRRSN